MKQPPGFIHPDYPNHVCKLTKAIYGLKQAPRAWFHHFSAFLISHGFACSKSDSSMFIYRSSSHILILLLYVDDIFLTVRTPIASRTSISLMDGELLSDPSEYRSMVGALQYLTMTHPDIAYAVNVVSQFMHAPRTTHMHCVKRTFRYLQGTLTYGLTLRALSPTFMVIAYSDADWAGCPDSRRSTSGFAMFLGSNLISWRAKKQPTVSKSSTEVEYRAIAYTVAETCWIRHILCELGIFLHEPIHVAQGDLIVQYVPTHLQLADICTKGLPSSQVCFLRDNLSVTPTSTD
uniref:Uncharacterized mitochondrial protein AtMg00810-like n=1 Tax=Nicotiana tabacum TaxID=4097 RepID=A0A1S4CLF4_TOBAC|nr:PREDICTED: uncharacterized mitochondrial protein AtMg00810-like [Nicotiana tabacum]